MPGRKLACRARVHKYKQVSLQGSRVEILSGYDNRAARRSRKWRSVEESIVALHLNPLGHAPHEIVGVRIACADQILRNRAALIA